jgi:molybdopterin synthase catalytic subunit
MSLSVTVRVLFFGLLKDITGKAEDRVDAPAGTTLASLFDQYAALHPKLAGLERSIVLALNQKFEPRDAPLADGDEVAFLPPVSGGSGDRYTHRIEDLAGHFFALTRHTIDTREISAQLLQGCDGAVTTFEGVVRNNSQGKKTLYLDYEAYEPMAVQTMAHIGREIAASHDVTRIAMVHRLGRMEIGEASVVIVVTAPHRKPAFDACLEGINRLKKLVPVWKKEHYEDGAVWVEGDWDDSLVNPRS